MINEIDKFITETICHSDKTLTGVTYYWMTMILKQEIIPPLVLDNSATDIEKFLMINLKCLDLSYRDEENNYLIVEKKDELDFSKFHKYKLIVFNGFQIKDLVQYQPQLVLMNTNIFISTNKFNALNIKSYPGLKSRDFGSALFRFIKERICNFDQDIFNKVIKFMQDVIQQKSSDVLILRANYPHDLQVFLALILSSLDFAYPNQKNFIEINKLDISTFKNLEKYKLVIFNGISAEEMDKYSKEILGIKTNIFSSLNKILVIEDLREALQLAGIDENYRDIK